MDTTQCCKVDEHVTVKAHSDNFAFAYRSKLWMNSFEFNRSELFIR